MGCVTGAINEHNIGLQSLKIRGKDVLGVSNLKLLENTREDGWIEVKRRRERELRRGVSA